MPRRLLSALLFAMGAAGASATAAPAQQIVLLAFGDSITQGYGDTSSMGGGYTRRLEHWIDQEGYDSAVENFGVGGETTGQGLSRIDGVLAGGGDYLLLMEGTNDISHRISTESIRFNLNEMANRAEALGMLVVHATVIPRIPTALVDADNTATSALAVTVRDLALISNRALVDNFAVFEGLPNVFENYYYYDPDVADPVGHPNTDGYMQIAGTFLEALLPLLASPHIRILPPAGPLETGALTAFGLSDISEFVRIEWEFGDGGFAVSSPPSDLSPYFYLHAGTYTVRVRAFTAAGEVAQHSVSVVVAGSEPAWETRTSLLPAVVESNDGLIVSDLRLRNSGPFYGIAEVTFVPEVSYDTAPPVRRLLVPPQGTTTFADALATVFGADTGRGALKVTFYVSPSGSTGAFSATSIVHSPSDPDGSDGTAIAEIPSASWSSSAKQIFGIPHLPGALALLDVANLDATSGSIHLEVYDAGGGYIGSGVLALAAGSARLRSLSDLFRDLDEHPAPFRVTLAESNVRFSAAALVADPASGEVLVLTGTP